MRLQLPMGQIVRAGYLILYPMLLGTLGIATAEGSGIIATRYTNTPYRGGNQ